MPRLLTYFHSRTHTHTHTLTVVWLVVWLLVWLVVCVEVLVVVSVVVGVVVMVVVCSRHRGNGGGGPLAQRDASVCVHTLVFTFNSKAWGVLPRPPEPQSGFRQQTSVLVCLLVKSNLLAFQDTACRDQNFRKTGPTKEREKELGSKVPQSFHRTWPRQGWERQLDRQRHAYYQPGNLFGWTS